MTFSTTPYWRTSQKKLVECVDKAPQMVVGDAEVGAGNRPLEVERIRENVTQHDMKEVVRDVHSAAHSLRLVDYRQVEGKYTPPRNGCGTGFALSRE
jgi:hypothetical protein